MTNELAAVQEVKTVAPKGLVKCTKCGKVAIKAEQVRDEENILLAVKYVHEMIPQSGYVWTCTQVMKHEPKFNTNGSVKKEMEKRPYAFKSRDATQYSGFYGERVDKL